MRKLAVVILAAGKGTRMKSDLPKVLHPILGLPMIEYPLRAARALKPAEIVVVVGHGGDAVQRVVEPARVRTVFQRRLRGTGDALATALRSLGGFEGRLLVLNGDMPLVTKEGLRHVLEAHGKRSDCMSVATFTTSEPGAYGRIVRDHLGRVMGIAEHKDASGSVRSIREVNGGVYVIDIDAARKITKIKASGTTGEIYLTALVEYLVTRGFTVGGVDLGKELLQGVNTRAELASAARTLRGRIVEKHMDRGVTFLDPETAWIHPDATIGIDSVVYPHVVVEGPCRIGARVRLYPGCRLVNARIADDAVVLDASIIEDSVVGKGAQVGPMAHVRPGSSVGADVRVGNFVELKKTRLARGTKASHLSYLGDAVVGPGVNIGAGTITCNYDGQEKHTTRIDGGAFIGSDTQLVAPVRVGKGAYVGAGTTLTEDVPAGALALTRTRETIIRGWARKRKRKRKNG